jgi:hypothetical protein
MKPKVTERNSRVLADLMGLSAPERLWVQQQYWQSLTREDREELQELLAESTGSAARAVESLYEQAKERLLEDPGLAAGEKVLLAALILSELYEIEDFHSRQITETLREASNPVNNITAALNGLIGKREAEITDTARAATNAHKRYRLTEAGRASASTIARRKRPGRAAP